MKPGAGDGLLRWASEAGAGKWDRLRDACAYLCDVHGLRERPWTLATRLSDLGHLDINWTTSTWSVAPPALNVIPGLGMCILLTGSRPLHLDRRFEIASDGQDVFPFDIPQDPAPRARFVKCSSIEAAKIVAQRLDAQLVIDPPSQLAQQIQRLDSYPHQPTPEPQLDEAKRFDPSTLAWIDNHQRAPGLYRIEIHGRNVHRSLDEEGRWFAIDLPVGQFLELRNRVDPVLRYRRAAGDKPSQFEVREGVALPMLAERALTLSSGLAPERVDGWRSYRNVSIVVAERIAESLLHRLAFS